MVRLPVYSMTGALVRVLCGWRGRESAVDPPPAPPRVDVGGAGGDRTGGTPLESDRVAGTGGGGPSDRTQFRTALCTAAPVLSARDGALRFRTGPGRRYARPEAATPRPPGHLRIGAPPSHPQLNRGYRATAEAFGSAEDKRRKVHHRPHTAEATPADLGPQEH